MIVSKHKLPNGNVLIWLGTGEGWGESEGVDNILVLDGGDVLLLKTIKAIPLWKEEVREDIENLSYEEFTEKYELPDNRDLWLDLKQGVMTGRYPPFKESSSDRISEFKNMISSYISVILQLKDPHKKIRQLEAIIGECHSKILEIRRKELKR